MTGPQHEPFERDPHGLNGADDPNNPNNPNNPNDPNDQTSNSNSPQASHEATDAPIGGGASNGAAANAASQPNNSPNSQSGNQPGDPAKKSRFAWFRKQGQAGAKQAKATATAGAEAFKTKHRTLAKLFFYKFDRFSLSTKLVACTLVVLIVGTVGISTAIRQLVSTQRGQVNPVQLPE